MLLAFKDVVSTLISITNTSSHGSTAAHARRTALWSAVAEDQLATVQFLHGWGAALEARSATDATSLHAAAACGSAHGVQLLRLGADPRALDGGGESAFFKVCRAGHVECAALLCAASAKAPSGGGRTVETLPNQRGATPMCGAVEKESLGAAILRVAEAGRTTAR